jgi:hypothetical protein
MPMIATHHNRRRGYAGFTMEYAQNLINRYFLASPVEI